MRTIKQQGQITVKLDQVEMNAIAVEILESMRDFPNPDSLLGKFLALATVEIGVLESVAAAIAEEEQDTEDAIEQAAIDTILNYKQVHIITEGGKPTNATLDWTYALRKKQERIEEVNKSPIKKFVNHKHVEVMSITLLHPELEMEEDYKN